MAELVSTVTDVRRPAAPPPAVAFVLSSTCHSQTAEKRFGSHVLGDIHDYVHDSPAGLMFDDGDEDEEDSEDSDDAFSNFDVEFNEDELDASSAIGVLPGGPPLQAGVPDLDPTLEPMNMEPQGFPRVARVRANLTALSQRYNLYFTAYQDKIYVYQPQKAPQILPPWSLILQPPRTKAAKAIGGTLDRQLPHAMNHIAVGELGDLEILVAAYDDGDVVGYYTHLIAHLVELVRSKAPRLQGPSGSRPVQIRPFFHENVGISAWGIAFHNQSRLFAISSNKHEVVVFAFATDDREKKATEKEDLSPKVWSGQTAMELERHFQSRTRTWKIILPVGGEGHNIPSIAILDDERGNAERVVAVDVKGNMWILDIWKIGGFPAVLQPSTITKGSTNAPYMGWGVLVLPDSSFRSAKDNQSAMGLYGSQILGTNQNFGDGIRNDIWLDITCSLYNVRDNAADIKTMLRSRHGNKYVLHNGKSQQLQQTTLQPSQALQALHQQYLDDMQHMTMPAATFAAQGFLDEFSDASSPLGSASSGSPSPQPALDPSEDTKRRWAPLKGEKPDFVAQINAGSERKRLGFLPARTILPTFGQTLFTPTLNNFQKFLSQSLHRKARSHSVPVHGVRFHGQVATNFAILRTTCTSVELQSLDPGTASVLCREVITQHNYHRRRRIPWDLSLHLCERISMLHHVPELGLVILGSLSGRVALLSLTRPPEPHRFAPGGSGDGVPIPRAFKVEALLPRKSDEEKKLRPWAALHGIAVGPAPVPRAPGLRLRRDGSPGEIWRLILHYMDHTILMYDLTRRLDSEELLIL